MSEPFCARHGGRPCSHTGCHQSRQGGTMYCIRHGGGYRCVSCKEKSVMKKGLYCWGCRKGHARQKAYEEMVEHFLNQDEHLKGFSYRDQSLPCAPNRRRPDFTYILPNHIVIVEVDEDSHHYCVRGYEITRILELHEQGRGLPIIIICGSCAMFSYRRSAFHHLKNPSLYVS